MDKVREGWGGQMDEGEERRPHEEADGELSANCIYHCYFKDARGIVPSTRSNFP